MLREDRSRRAHFSRRWEYASHAPEGMGGGGGGVLRARGNAGVHGGSHRPKVGPREGTGGGHLTLAPSSFRRAGLPWGESQGLGFGNPNPNL